MGKKYEVFEWREKNDWPSIVRYRTDFCVRWMSRCMLSPDIVLIRQCLTPSAQMSLDPGRSTDVYLLKALHWSDLLSHVAIDAFLFVARRLNRSWWVLYKSSDKSYWTMDPVHGRTALRFVLETMCHIASQGYVIQSNRWTAYALHIFSFVSHSAVRRRSNCRKDSILVHARS